MNILPPAAFQTQSVEICSADISEPVLKITDRRIRELLAKSTTDKMMLKSSMEELEQIAKRHDEYRKAGEQAELLVEIAFTIKHKLKEAEVLEKKLIAEFGSLTLLLEMLNFDGEDEDKKKGVELSNKIQADLKEYKSIVNNFSHHHRAKLTFAIQRGYTSQQSSAASSRNNSLDRGRPHASRYFDHLKPNKVTWEDDLEAILEMIDKYEKWMKEISIVHGTDPEYEWTP